MRRRLPGRRPQAIRWVVVAWIAALAAIAVGAGAWSESLGATPRDVSWPSVIGLLVALTVAGCLHVEFRHSEDDVDALDLFEAALAPALFLLPGAPVIALVAVAKVGSEALLRVRPVKAAFNVAAWSAAAATGSVALAGLRPGPPAAGRDLLALAVAMVVVVAVNQMAYLGVLRLAERQRLSAILADLRPAIVPAWLVGGGVILSFGLLFAAAVTWSPAIAWLLPVPLWALHWASQSYAASRADLSRVQALHQATRALAAAPDAEAGIAVFLADVRAALRADAVELATSRDGALSLRQACAGDEGRHDPADLALISALVAGDQAVRVTALSPDPAIREGLRLRGCRDCLAAPVPTSGTARHVLFVYEPRGLLANDTAELRVLEGLAREVGAALTRAEAEVALRTSEARFRALVQHSSDLVVVLDAGGAMIDVLPAADASPIRFALGSDIAGVAHPDDAATVRRCFGQLLDQPGATATLTWRARAVDGSWRHLETMWTNLLADPAVAGVVLNSRDTTDRERAAALVAGQAEVLGTISRRQPLDETVDALAHAVEAQAPGSRYTVVLLKESGGTAVMGSPLPRPLIDALASVLVVDEEPAGGQGRRRSVIVSDVAAEPRWARAVGKEEIRAVWAAPIDRSDGGGTHGLAVLHFDHPRRPDPSDRRVLESAADLAHIAVEAVAAEARLVHQATHDPLTGLPNRLLFLDRTTVALSRLARSGRSVAVLFVDLDRFKTVNDSLGHEVGDRLLVALAGRLRGIMRPSDTVARFGGDEFTILCEDIHDEDEAAAIATRVREVLAEPVALEGHELYVTASVGIAHTADHERPAQGLVEDADAAMYRAKRAGGNVHQVYDVTVRSRALLDLVTHQALRKAIDRDELLVYYQPAIDLESGRVVGAEALVRWDHPQRGIMGPLDFIPLAEQTGLIVPLGTHVLNEACSQTRRWREQLGDGFTMSVNLSARQFADPCLPDIVAAALARSGATPSSIALEITESALMEDAESTMVALFALKDLGVRLAIDDFGTGYSSLTYLKRFPVDVLKVDKSFVDGLGNDAGDEAIVRTVVELAHTLGMTAVAEGVETDVQVQLLQDLLCDTAQGYWFSRPLPPGQVVFDDTSLLDLRPPLAGAGHVVPRRPRREPGSRRDDAGPH